MKLYVANIDYTVNEMELEGLFQKFGEIESTKIIYDRITSRSRGFGFVEMPNSLEAQNAISGLNGKELKGRELKVSEAEDRRKFKVRF